MERAVSALWAQSPDCSYPVWRNTYFALHATVGHAADDEFHRWSQGSDRYDRDETEKLIKSARTRRDGIGPGTLFKMARDAGWTGEGESAAVATDRAASPDTATRAARDLSQFVVSVDPSRRPGPGREFAIGAGADGMLPTGKVGVLAGAGGSMKTALALTWGAHVSAGAPWGGRRVAQGGALVLSFEDDAEELTRRVSAIVRGMDDPRELLRRLRIIAMPGHDTRLTQRLYGSPERTALVDSIVAEAERLASDAGMPVRLIVVDHARLAIGGDVNDSEAVTELLRALASIGDRTGAAVLLLCHSPKSSLSIERGDDFSASDVLGSGAFVDNARFAAVISPLTVGERKRHALDAEGAKQYLALRVIKSNYSASGGVQYLAKRPVEGWGVALPEPYAFAPIARAVPARDDVAARIVELVRELPGRISLRGLRLHAGKDGRLGGGDAKVRDTAAALIESGVLVLRPPTPEERDQHALPPQTKEVLHVP